MSVNVEIIMEEIRQKIKDEHLTCQVPPFDDVPLMTSVFLQNNDYDPVLLQSYTEYAIARSRLDYNAPIQGKSLKCFVKRMIRKLMQFYIVPIIAQQNAVNYNYSNALVQINGFIQKSENNDVGILHSRIEELELKELYNSREIAELKEQIRLLRSELHKP